MKFAAALIVGGLMINAAGVEAQQDAHGNSLRNAFVANAKLLVASAELMPEASYGLKPFEGGRTYLQLIAHVADGYNYYCQHALGNEVEWTDSVEKTATTRAAALSALQASVARCAEAYTAPAARFDPLLENLAHANLHYGNVIVYLRLAGIVPPSSR